MYKIKSHSRKIIYFVLNATKYDTNIPQTRWKFFSNDNCLKGVQEFFVGQDFFSRTVTEFYFIFNEMYLFDI